MFPYVILAFWFTAVLAKPDFAIFGPALDFSDDYQESATFDIEMDKEIRDQPVATRITPTNSNKMDCVLICILGKNGCLAVNYREGACEIFNRSISQSTTARREGSMVLAFTQPSSTKGKSFLLDKITQLLSSSHLLI